MPAHSRISAEQTEKLKSKLGLSEGDAVFFVAGVPSFAAFAGGAG